MRTNFSSLALVSILAMTGFMAGCQTEQAPSSAYRGYTGSYYNAQPPGPTLAERRAAGYEFGGFDTSGPNNNGRNNAETTVPDDNLGSNAIRIGLLFD